MSDQNQENSQSDGSGWDPVSARPTGALVLADGTVFYGQGLGATGHAVGEVCFNTAITGYQEILTDPSYAGQIITFTFPHIGNVGTNGEDIETTTPVARGFVVRQKITDPSNFRNDNPLGAWAAQHGLIGIAGLDTRALTRAIRTAGAPTGIVAHDPDGNFDLDTLKAEAAQWPGLEGMDLARDVSCTQSYDWTESLWALGQGYGVGSGDGPHIVALDFGVKRNILRNLASLGARVTVVPGNTSADDILARQPDGIFLSNGPGDPAATGTYAVPTIQALIDSGKPIFGICLGHQMLALALGAKTEKMHQGHRGANHPVKDLTTGKVEITSQNHGFVVSENPLPDHLDVTHRSLFDGTIAGIAVREKPIFSVQYHPEASPGPQDSHYLFSRFLDAVKAAHA